MKLQTLVITSYGSSEVVFSLSEDCAIKLELSEQERDQLTSMCIQFYSERQMKIADLVQNSVPRLADFSEVEDAAG